MKVKDNFILKRKISSTFNMLCLVTFVTTSTFVLGCSTRPQGGTLLGGATGAAVGSMIGRGKGSTGAMLGLGLLGALAGNQLFDKPSDERDMEYDRRDDYEYRRRLRDDWRRDEYRDRDSGYYDDEYYDSRRDRDYKRDNYRY